MRTIQVKTPTGEQWRVRVVWQPRWRLLARRFGGWRAKKRRSDGNGSDIVDGVAQSSGEDICYVLAFILFMIVVGALFWWVLLPLLLLVLDLAVVIILLVLSVPARVMFRRPWCVEAIAEQPDGVEERFAVDIIGWRRALRARDDIVEKIRLGYPTPMADLLSPMNTTVEPA